MNNTNIEIINATSKSGNNYQCLELTINTPVGKLVKRLFLTELELNAVKQALNPMQGIYSNDNSNTL